LGQRDDLSDSPFMKALSSRSLQKFIVVPNVTESLYCRLWCVAELWKAMELELEKNSALIFVAKDNLAPSAKCRRPADSLATMIRGATCSDAHDERRIRSFIKGHEEHIQGMIQMLAAPSKSKATPSQRKANIKANIKAKRAVKRPALPVAAAAMPSAAASHAFPEFVEVKEAENKVRLASALAESAGAARQQEESARADSARAARQQEEFALAARAAQQQEESARAARQQEESALEERWHEESALADFAQAARQQEEQKSSSAALCVLASSSFAEDVSGLAVAPSREAKRASRSPSPIAPSRLWQSVKHLAPTGRKETGPRLDSTGEGGSLGMDSEHARGSHHSCDISPISGDAEAVEDGDLEVGVLESEDDAEALEDAGNVGDDRLDELLTI